MSEKIYDSIVIGAGPAGITAALYLARAGLNIALIEKGAVGGQVLLTAEIENYPGFPRGIKGWELADLLEAQIQPYMLRRLQTEVTAIEVANAEKKYHTLKTGRGDILTKSVIIASGASYKHLGIDAEQKYQGKGVSYCAVCDGNFHKGKEVVVIGGGNSALEEALYLSRIVKHVHLVHRRNEFRASHIYEQKVRKTENISLITPAQVQDIQGETGVEKVIVKNLESNEIKEISVSGVFVFVGTKASAQFFPKELKCAGSGFVHTDAEMKTNISGIFAAGDIREKHCKQVTTAVGDGATAAMAAVAYVEQLDV